MKYTKPDNIYQPSINRKDKIDVPENKIYVLTESALFNNVADNVIQNLNGIKKRDWFNQNFYFCLPLTIGNQYGFIVRSITDILVRWDGNDSPEGLSVITPSVNGGKSQQIISSHFGSGILTIQNRWTYRTPKGINLYVTQPPNFPLHGIHFMSAVIETDNLRRDFTFNLKITQPHTDIFIPQGSPIGFFIPYPRHMVDQYNIERLEEGNILEEERITTTQEFSKIRKSADGKPDMLYMRGVDAYNNKFEDHQRGLDKCPYHRKIID
jgi:hypothetical protein